MITNSKYSTLFLGSDESWKTFFERDVCYFQKVATTDQIRIQFSGYSSIVTANYENEMGDITSIQVTELIYDQKTGKRQLECFFSVKTAGFYRFNLFVGSTKASAIFKVITEEEKKGTILLTYSHRKNDYDTIFRDENGARRVFQFRVDGGILPSERAQSVENEIFRDQRHDPHQTAAQAFEVSTLRIGSSRGVPTWVGNKINHIFCLSDIFIDGNQAVRNEGSAPSIVRLLENHPLYVFKINIEMDDKETIKGEQAIEKYYLTDNAGKMITTNNGSNITVRR